jgi:hypothetical protein
MARSSSRDRSAGLGRLATRTIDSGSRIITTRDPGSGMDGRHAAGSGTGKRASPLDRDAQKLVRAVPCAADLLDDPCPVRPEVVPVLGLNAGDVRIERPGLIDRLRLVESETGAERSEKLPG